MCARGGINSNRKKFRFAKDQVDYVGFTLTKDAIRPADSMTESIRKVPAPKNITQARTFFWISGARVIGIFKMCRYDTF